MIAPITPLSIAATLMLATMNSTATREVVFDFQTPTTVKPWEVVNDDVMGGVSQSDFFVTNGVAVFTGNLSLEYNGGFASVRSLPSNHDLEGCQSFLLRVRGDGRRYKFTARMDRRFDSPIYQAAFPTMDGEWQEHLLPLNEFVSTFRGRVLTGEPPLNPARIASLGFLVSDKQAGPFRLEIAWIKAVRIQSDASATAFESPPLLHPETVDESIRSHQ